MKRIILKYNDPMNEKQYKSKFIGANSIDVYLIKIPINKRKRL